MEQGMAMITLLGIVLTFIVLVIVSKRKKK
ncbi:LPXTG cell wall anchor domain-containing protein [Caldalkalibacillus salinus]|nr:LPXTG cell wall anchor domain-containing protein [Caldalkalibacillus salinus]